MIGTTLSHYRITAKLGQGGMGEVWRATDEKLGREVALKLLPEDFASDPDRHARFEREAKVLASLNHPNIATLYGLEHVDGSHVLVMELVEGKGLDQLIARGPIPSREASAIAVQIAEALEVAHEAGIVHRDLKPANIMVTDDGVIKVLDFGLAKSWETAGGDSSLSLSPTMTRHATMEGVILGTAAYMSPEQARGKKVDRRADIWAFGVVLWEMLTGRKLFEGETVSDVLAAVLRAEPDFSELPVDTAPMLSRLIARCLERNPRLRLQAIGEARILLADSDEAVVVGNSIETPTDRPSRVKGYLGWLVALLALVACATLWFSRSAPENDGDSLRLTINLPDGWSLVRAPAISPDGRVIAYSAVKDDENEPRIFLRRLDDFESHQVENSRGGVLPFFSPDSRWFGFYARNTIYRASVAGSAPERITPATAMIGASWGADDTVVFSTGLGSPLYQVPATGGEPVPLTSLEGNDYAHVWPQHLSDGNGLLFVAWSSGSDGGSNFLSTRDGSRTRLDTGYKTLRDAHKGMAVTEERDDGLSVVEFNSVTGKTGHERVKIIDDVYYGFSSTRSWSAMSDNGTLIWIPGDPSAKSVKWMARDGVTETVLDEAGNIGYIELSPDGRRVLVEPGGDIWVIDLDRETQTRVTFSERNDLDPRWSPDGRLIVFASNRDERWAIYSTTSNGDGSVNQILKTDHPTFPTSVASDGRILYEESHPTTGRDLWILQPDGTTTPFSTNDYDETQGVFSPGGSLIAYVSNPNRQDEVYVRNADGSGQSTQASNSGGGFPVWSSDGRSLYYRSGRAILEVDVSRGSTIDISPPRIVFEGANLDLGPFDVSHDGQRFLVKEVQPEAKPTEIRVMTNAFSVFEAALAGTR